VKLGGATPTIVHPAMFLPMMSSFDPSRFQHGQDITASSELSAPSPAMKNRPRNGLIPKTAK
jgi:hypothetical protein